MSPASPRMFQAEKPYLRTDLPDVTVGDSVEVDLKIKEGEKERIQTFAGTVIAVRGGGLAKTFTVRRIVQGEGVERILPWHSPLIDAIRVTKKGKVRRAKLYYMRKRVGKATRLVEIIGDGAAAPAGRDAAQEEAVAPAETTGQKKAEPAAEPARSTPAGTKAAGPGKGTPRVETPTAPK